MSENFYTSSLTDNFSRVTLFLSDLQNHNTSKYLNSIAKQRHFAAFEHRQLYRRRPSNSSKTPPWVCRRMLRNALRSSSSWPRPPCTGASFRPSCIWVSAHITSIRIDSFSVIGFSCDRVLLSEFDCVGFQKGAEMGQPPLSLLR